MQSRKYTPLIEIRPIPRVVRSSSSDDNDDFVYIFSVENSPFPFFPERRGFAVFGNTSRSRPFL